MTTRTDGQMDVVIAGAGAAGLSAALILGRARRRVLVLDGGPPRNAPAAASHVNRFFLSSYRLVSLNIV